MASRLIWRGLEILADWRESFFLGLANGLPRLRIADQWRASFVAMAGARIGKNVIIWSPLEIRPIGGARRIAVGDRVFINSGVRMACPEPATITVGCNIMIGPCCLFETMNHSLTYQPDGSRPGAALSIRVEDNVWIGARATILPGVTIGNGSVIAAGSVVVENVPAHTLVGGVPARVLKNIEQIG